MMYSEISGYFDDDKKSVKTMHLVCSRLEFDWNLLTRQRALKALIIASESAKFGSFEKTIGKWEIFGILDVKMKKTKA
jgi:hypothetical protein